MALNKGLSLELNKKLNDVKKFPVLQVAYQDDHFVMMALVTNQVQVVKLTVSKNDLRSIDELLLEMLVAIRSLVDSYKGSDDKNTIIGISYWAFYYDVVLRYLDTGFNHDLLFGELLNLYQELTGQEQTDDHLQIMKYETALDSAYQKLSKDIDQIDFESFGDDLGKLAGTVKALIADLTDNPVKGWLYLAVVLKLARLNGQNNLTLEYLVNHSAVFIYYLLQLESAETIQDILKDIEF